MLGRDDFNFLFDGPWRVANRRLDRDGECRRFDARSTVEPLPGGHLDRLMIPDLPGVGAVEAFTVRLFEPATGLWRIWWSSSARPGHFDPPMTGRFTEGVGTFTGDDALGDARLRFEWRPHEPTGPRWEQARSLDDGATWSTDWIMDFSRDDA